MNVKYDRAEDILLLEVSEGDTIDHAEQSGSLIAHFSADGHLVLLEILDASEFLTDILKASLRSEDELSPLPL